eukprot:m51a1_g3544 hypothetical protein (481) ;mRNA; f:988778-990464
MEDQPAGPAVIAQFVCGEDGQPRGPQLELPASTSTEQLTDLINRLLTNEEDVPYSFYVNDEEVVGALPAGISSEQVLRIVYVPQAVFRVRPVTRTTATLSGHTDSVLCVQFSTDGNALASCGGDRTVRIWDLTTQTPKAECKGHRDWVLCVAWSPDCSLVASGARDGDVRVWDAKTGKQHGNPLSGHKGFISAICWEPLAAQSEPGASRRLASACKDGSVRVWDARTGRCEFALGGHTDAVAAVKWGADGLIYTAGRDRLVIVHSGKDGARVRTMRGHAHWVNSLSLCSDFVARTGPYDHTFAEPEGGLTSKAAWEAAKAKYAKFAAQKPTTAPAGERVVTGSDDGTLILWSPQASAKPVARMTGHQQQILCVCFSPDGRLIASGSYDKSVKLWDGFSGKFLATFRQHVGAVYQVAWAPDSRMLVSASKDSTLKLWDTRTRTNKGDLPGHTDEVFAVDWAPDGERVASGSFDRTLKLWHH